MLQTQLMYTVKTDVLLTLCSGALSRQRRKNKRNKTLEREFDDSDIVNNFYNLRRNVFRENVCQTSIAIFKSLLNPTFMQLNII